MGCGLVSPVQEEVNNEGRETVRRAGRLAVMQKTQLICNIFVSATHSPNSSPFLHSVLPVLWLDLWVYGVVWVRVNIYRLSFEEMKQQPLSDL